MLLAEKYVFDHLCRTCKVYVDTESEHAKEFLKIHALCHTMKSQKRYGRGGHRESFLSVNFKDLDEMTDVGRALVFERLLDRLKAQVKFVEDVSK